MLPRTNVEVILVLDKIFREEYKTRHTSYIFDPLTINESSKKPSSSRFNSMYRSLKQNSFVSTVCTNDKHRRALYTLLHYFHSKSCLRGQSNKQAARPKKKISKGATKPKLGCWLVSKRLRMESKAGITVKYGIVKSRGYFRRSLFIFYWKC